jgi:hypothetical protein
MKSEETARLFHDTYERLAPEFGYKTKAETKTFDPSSPNGRLMIATVREVMTKASQLLQRREATLKLGKDKHSPTCVCSGCSMGRLAEPTTEVVKAINEALPLIRSCMDDAGQGCGPLSDAVEILMKWELETTS